MEKEEAIVTLKEESHNPKLSNKLSIGENGEEMNYFVKEWWWCVVRPSKEEEGSVYQIFLRLSTYNQTMDQ
jgi:hypothetical protein